MINRAKRALLAAVLVASFASPVFADCLESGAAESCGGGGSYQQGWPNLQPQYRGYADDGTRALWNDSDHS
jgi:hypothetical protein